MTDALLPAAGQCAVLTVVRTGADLPTFVEDDVSADCLLVFAPLGLDGNTVDSVPDGAALLLKWTSPAGRHEVDATLVRRRRGRVALWQVAATGAARTSQLRRYARASDGLTGELTRGRESWSVTVGDLSEGGARVLLAGARGLVAGDGVMLYVTVEDQRLTLPGHVLPFRTADVGRTQLRLEFGDIGRAADVLRRRVLALQIQARRAAAGRA
jgi:hypothetical protein